MLLESGLIGLVDKVHHYLYHDIFLLRPALGNHERERNERIVGNALGTVFMIEDAIIVHKPEEKRSGNALVTVRERMVFGYEKEQHGSFLFYTGI